MSYSGIASAFLRGDVQCAGGVGDHELLRHKRKMMGWVYFALMLADVGLVFTQLYFIISFSDLENDYKSPYSLCESMDTFYPIEILTQAGIVATVLISREWVSVAVLAPVFLWNIYVWQTNGLRFDATTIFRRLPALKAEAFAKLAYYVLCFCYLLYSMIWWLVVVE